ncbi:MCP four helix bundle domain-containing protein [Jiulongibacter sp. NS-SX5]|uniref:MCP four helix bundle domain-containing protein n=1 Tax=Jiulongibacter sp. NS-SX5 TaxID=3463854 RepID=UPI00405871C0
MSLFEKIKWVLGILLVFIIVLTTNLVDRSNFNRIRSSVETIYEDRIVVNDLIFEISTIVHKKEIALRTGNASFFERENEIMNENIEGLISRYELTRITPNERIALNHLKTNLNDIEELESTLNPSEIPGSASIISKLERVKNNLTELSKIQLREGKKEKLTSDKTFETVDLFTKIEMVFLIVMGVLIQIIILYKGKGIA